MMKMTRHTVHVLLLLASLTQLALAEDAPRQFDVELLIFQNLAADDGGEVWPVDYSDWFDEDTTGTDGQLNSPFWLDSKNMHLQAEQVALKHSGNYRPLRHIAWRQTVVERNRAEDIEIAGDNTAPTTVEGTVRVAVERYLHLYLDLKLIDRTLARQTGFGDTEIPEFRLKTHRRMRSGELHYFDHPKFGVVALITPYAPAPPTETDPPATKSGQ